MRSKKHRRTPLASALNEREMVFAMRRFHELPTAELAALDIAEVNLECATRLPGSENLDMPCHLATLDHWAERIRSETKHAWPIFKRNPAKFNRSRAYFRLLVMVTVLQRDLGVLYNLDSLEGPIDFTDSRLHFIHGILEGHGGTCATLPVLYVGLGRRLGYPLKLVQTLEHLFVRWDDPQTGVRLNIETTSRGLNCHPDEYYRTWPKPVRSDFVAKGWLLKSLTRQEELALFYDVRGRCFLDWAEFGKALELAHYASRLAGERNPFYQGFHSLATVLHFQDIGYAKYGFKKHGGQGIVVQHGRERPMEPWEPWAVREAQKQLARIREIHEAKRSRRPARCPAIAIATADLASADSQNGAVLERR